MMMTRKQAGSPGLPGCRLGGWRSPALLGTLTALTLAGLSTPAPAHNGWKEQVEKVFGMEGQDKPEGVLRFNIVRNNMTVFVDGIPTRPNLIMDGYAAFHKQGNTTLMTAELTLLQKEVNPVIEAIAKDNLDLTAVHNHNLFDRPHIIYVHFTGEGNAVQLAQAFEDVLSKTGIPRTNDDNEQDGDDEGKNLDTQKLDHLFGQTGEWVDKVYEISVDRAEHVTYEGLDMPGDMGPQTEIHFQPIRHGVAIVATEIAVTGKEMAKVTRILKEGGLQITADHNHFTREEPRLFWIHTWSVGDPVKISEILRKALDATNSK